MKIQTILKTTLVAATMLAANSAMAMPLYSGSYDLANAGNADTRGLWTNDGRFSTVSGSFDVTGSSAVLSGDVYRSAISGGFTFAVNMSFRCSSSVTADPNNTKKVSIDDNGATGCNGMINQPTGGAVTGADVDGNTWDFWDWSNSQLIGYGSLDGLVIDISMAPTNDSKPYRVGIGADWDDANLLGASGWVNFDGANCDLTKACANTWGSSFSATKADFNFRYTAVSEPAILAIMGLGLLGVAVARRK